MVLMEKPEVIKKFLEKGYQLNSESLKFFYQNQEKIDSFLVNIVKLTRKPTTITFDLAIKFSEIKPKKYNVEVLKQLGKGKEVVTVGDFIDFFLRRYESIKHFLVNRLDLVNLISINKITQKTKKFSLITMVKEKNEEDRSFVVEDTTGELTVFFDEKVADFYNVVQDEVLGLVCEKENDVVKVKNLLFPDVPLKREVNKTKENVFCLFISDLHMDSDDFLKDSYEKFLNWIKKTNYEKFYIFVLGDISKKKEDIKDFFDSLPSSSFKIFLKGSIDPEIQAGDLILSDPSMLKVEKAIISLVCHGAFFYPYQIIWKNTTAENILLNLLKKRHVNPVNNEIYEKDPFVLDIIPDIFVSGFFHYPSAINYKGTTIITTGSFVSKPIFWLLSLRTREVIKLDFS